LHRRAQDESIGGSKAFLLQAHALVHDGCATFFLACRSVLRKEEEKMIHLGHRLESERFWNVGDGALKGETECDYHFWKDIKRPRPPLTPTTPNHTHPATLATQAPNDHACAGVANVMPTTLNLNGISDKATYLRLMGEVKTGLDIKGFVNARQSMLIMASEKGDHWGNVTIGGKCRRLCNVVLQQIAYYERHHQQQFARCVCLPDLHSFAAVGVGCNP
jgi:hypothetical protein